MKYLYETLPDRIGQSEGGGDEFFIRPLIDCAIFVSETARPSDFWESALSQLSSEFLPDEIGQFLEEAERNNYDHSFLRNLFGSLRKKSKRVVLLLDNFEELLELQNFTASFFYLLHSLTMPPDPGLVLVLSSRRPRSTLEERAQSKTTQYYNRRYFHHIKLIKLSPLEQMHTDSFLDESTWIPFSNDQDKTFLHIIAAGGHPYLAQGVVASLAETFGKFKDAKTRYSEAAKLLHQNIGIYFYHIWSDLDPHARLALIVIVLQQVRGQLKDQILTIDDDHRPPEFGRTVRQLIEEGIIEEVTTKDQTDWRGLVRDGEETYYRIAAESFVWWLFDKLVVETRDEADLRNWLDEKKLRKWLTQEKWDVISGWANEVFGLTGYDVYPLFETTAAKIVSDGERRDDDDA